MPTTILHDIEQSFESATSGWYAAVFPFASSLFFALVAIELTWAAIRWTLERDDGVSILISLFRHIVAVSFFWALLLHAPEWMGAVVDSFQLIGARVSGLPTLNPSTVLDQGFAVCGGIFTSLATTGFFSAPMAHIIAIVAVLMVIISFTVVAGQMLVALIESFLVLSAGVLLLGFAGSRWTKSIAEK